MNPPKSHHQKIKAEMLLAQNKLAEFKDEPRSLTVANRANHIRHIEELEQRLVDVRAQWQQLHGAGDDGQQQMTSHMDSVWKALQDEIQATITDVQS